MIRTRVNKENLVLKCYITYAGLFQKCLCVTHSIRFCRFGYFRHLIGTYRIKKLMDSTQNVPLTFALSLQRLNLEKRMLVDLCTV